MFDFSAAYTRFFGRIAICIIGKAARFGYCRAAIFRRAQVACDETPSPETMRSGTGTSA
jgi:hypothetical protein